VAEYEYRAFTLPPGSSTRHAREVLGIHAEYGDWELLRHAIFEGGVRKVTVRRRIRPEPLPPLPS
jgi:hypothetical protein